MLIRCSCLINVREKDFSVASLRAVLYRCGLVLRSIVSKELMFVTMYSLLKCAVLLTLMQFEF